MSTSYDLICIGCNTDKPWMHEPGCEGGPCFDDAVREWLDARQDEIIEKLAVAFKCNTPEAALYAVQLLKNDYDAFVEEGGGS